MENANILTLFWASFLYTPSLKSLCQLLKRIWSYSSSSTFSSNLALFRPTSGRGLASCFPRLRLRVFHTAVRYGKRHVKLIETSAEERDKCLEHCCLVIHLTSVNTVSYAESNGGIFVLIGRIKPEIRRSKCQSKVNRESPKRKEKVRKKKFERNLSSKKGIRKTWRIILSGLSFKGHKSLE
jgi:hypothetical protein